ncbi:hypothetical protein A2291_03770 [candidate division WOR-1 bacterium RIFOXYB2_FULL_42_35]|uniref:Fibronectin type-III domain-containing protein n=1 Tax=candidate division WOR-1 bacterium RIFOXYC2_FULL_41_25 TaxID=1802586 RepID=A0A1F4TQK7_UNCSA|nr:MAG: hypothetical protein A2247_00025 [candidate division WOR-1 bacterium RIFOXYA2_FULL_41_14]OGC25580.1 MAG: hypothetical protein A2291_03770 [candidate division WOR-1 bacterium RIFOXYB2_FULL_42_35]OGC35012.1 MAG: hypothetical protein A2462_05400 [candidate division WOR-1 bacterium RIFOXYC2_FULL_41_25]OGC44204.1 MAG: hypothetical protein A2548_02910 [candidate division WOR-1 bacterium RIFOXYD2_FULL_41_8]
MENMLKKLTLIIAILLTTIGVAQAYVSNPVQSVVNPITQTLYVAGNSSTPGFVAYDRVTDGWTTTNQVKSLIPATAKCYGLDVTPDGKQLLVSVNNYPNSELRLYVLDSSGKPTTTYWTVPWVTSNQATPVGVAIASDNSRAYVADTIQNKVYYFDHDLVQDKWSYAGELTGITAAYNIALSPVKYITVGTSTIKNYQIFVSSKSSSGQVHVCESLGPTTIAYRGSVSVSAQPTQLKVNHLGTRLYVAVNGATGGDIKVFDIQSFNPYLNNMKTISSVAGDYGWTGFNITPDESKLYYTQARDFAETSTGLYSVNLPVTVDTTATSVATINGNFNGVAMSPDGLRYVLTYSGDGSFYPLTGGTGGYSTGLQPIVSQITAITPNTTTYGTNVNVTITGNFFLPGALPYLLDGSYNSYVLSNVSVKSSTTITATIDNNIFSQLANVTAGYDLQIINNNPFLGTSPAPLAYESNAFTINKYTPPVTLAISSIYPSISPVGKTVVVGISGTNFLTTPNVTLTKKTLVMVNGQQAYVTSTITGTVVSTESTKLKVSFTIAANQLTGQWNLTVVNPNSDTATAINGFEIIPTPDTILPSTVQDIKGTDGETEKTTLTWNNPPENDIALLRIMRGTSPDGDYPTLVTGTLVADILAPKPAALQTYIDTGLTGGTTYYYTVYTQDTSGNWSTDISIDVNAVRVVPAGSTTPGVIVINSGGKREGDIASSSPVTISWQTNPPNQAVNVWYKDTTLNNTGWQKLNSTAISETSYTDPNIKVGDGTTRFYKILPVSATAVTTDDLTQEVVGKFDISLEIGFNLVSLPLIPANNLLDNVIGSQLASGAFSLFADQIQKFNGNGYDIAWLKTITGGNKWYTGSTATTITTAPNDGFWIKSATKKHLTIVGRIAETNRSFTMKSNKTYNLVGSPFPVTVALDNSGLAENATSGTFSLFAAKVQELKSSGGYDIAWLKNTTGKLIDSGNKWYTSSSPTTMKFSPGKGYWVSDPGTINFTWEYIKPY